MADIIIPTILIGFVGLAALFLAILTMYKKSYATSAWVKYPSMILASLALFSTLYIKVLNPAPPEALAICEQVSTFAPTQVNCFNKSSGYTSLIWEFENGKTVSDIDTIERNFEEPGEYSVKLTAINKNLFRTLKSDFEAKFSIQEQPKPKPIYLDVPERISTYSSINRTQKFTFTPKPGFKILNGSVSVNSSNFSGIRTAEKEGDNFIVIIDFNPQILHSSFKNYREKAFIDATVLIHQEKIHIKE
ncbi:MAG: hypothetical protein PHI97_32880 [Desulfobulbus sp.]|nr:hypothetical protein [Desulfobulbus sp.]